MACIPVGWTVVPHGHVYDCSSTCSSVYNVDNVDFKLCFPRRQLWTKPLGWNNEIWLMTALVVM
jgi:hypothetical protein